MSSEVGARKRSRMATSDDNAMDAGSAGAHWKRVKEFWFDDGNIILIAEDQGFRVYRGLLSRHSQVFRDMFCIPQPNAAETLDGCPIVRLSGDSPADLTHVFRIVFGASVTSSTLGDRRLPFAVIAAMIRIGHKYAMESLQAQAITRLQSLFPTRYLFSTTIESHFSFVPANATPLDAFTAVNLGRLTGQTSILPFAFYICAQYDNELVNGVTLNGRFERLAPDDITRCVAAKIKLAQARASSALRLFCWSDAHKLVCNNHGHCATRFASILLELSADYQSLATCKPFDGWKDYISIHSKSFCSSCLYLLREKERMERKQLWEDLPSIFGLHIQGWPQNEVYD